MAWKLPNGKTIQTPKDIVVDDTQYPSEIFRRWSKEELNAVGIFHFREVGFNKGWFTSTGSSEEEVDGEIVRTHTTKNRYLKEEAKDIQIDVMKSRYIAEKRRALEQEDFYDAVGDSDTKKLWSDYITALKNDAKGLKDAVNAAGTYDAIVNFEFQWTEAPDALVEEVIDGPV